MNSALRDGTVSARGATPVALTPLAISALTLQRRQPAAQQHAAYLTFY